MMALPSLWTSSTGSVSTLSDEDLDTMTRQILETFPTLGGG